jgi:ABC-type multidrug transport system fused ATPase/permease subunit
MSGTQNTNALNPEVASNGSVAAAILSAGIGCLALALFTVIGDHSAALKTLLAFSKPVGPLSGVTTIAVVFWIAAWIVLDLLWKRRELPSSRIGWGAIALFVLSVLLTFPPLADLF